MDAETIGRFREALSRWCWVNDLWDFREVTGFDGSFAAQRFRDLQDLNSAIGKFDSTTLATILNSQPRQV